MTRHQDLVHNFSSIRLGTLGYILHSTGGYISLYTVGLFREKNLFHSQSSWLGQDQILKDIVPLLHFLKSDEAATLEVRPGPQ